MRRSLRVTINAFGILTYFMFRIIPLPMAISMPVRMVSLMMLKCKTLLILELVDNITDLPIYFGIAYEYSNSLPISLIASLISYLIVIVISCAIYKLVSKLASWYLTKRLPDYLMVYLKNS